MDALGPHVALGTDGIGADMFEESRAAYFRLREDDLASPPSWPLERLAEGAGFVGRRSARVAIRKARSGRSRRPRRPRLRRAGPCASRASQDTGSSASRPATSATSWSGAMGRGTGWTRVDQQELAAEARLEAERLWKRLDDVGAHTFHPKGGGHGRRH